MPHNRDFELTEVHYHIAALNAQLQQARTKEERDSLNEEIDALWSQEREVRIARRRRAAARRRWERIHRRPYPDPANFPPHDPSVQYLFEEKKIEQSYDDEWPAVDAERGILERVPGEGAFDLTQRIVREYAKTKDGDHKSVRRVLQRAYVAARKMQDEPDQFKLLQDDSFWNASLHKPTDALTSKWVVHFIMQAKTPHVRHLADKYVAILDRLMRDNVMTADARVGKMEGVEAAYEAWQRRPRLRGLKSGSRRQDGNG
jgi:hypothetical protein